MTPTAQILICQNRSCRRAGAAKVLQTFQQLASSACAVTPCGCLGHCGSGPTVLILPEVACYEYVRPGVVNEILQHEGLVENDP